MPDEQNTGGTPPQDTQPGGKPGDGQQGGETLTYDSWLAKQDDSVKGLLNGHIHGLKSALDSERQQRQDLAKQLKELGGKAEKGSELEKALSEATGKLELAEKRANFAEEAVKPEIGCSNIKAAWLVAMAEDLFDRHGNPNWEAIKRSAPELFRKPAAPNANAGSGTQAPQQKVDMNSLLRQAAGRS